MRIVILAVGPMKEPAYRTLADEYYGRIRRHFPIDEIEIADGPPDKLGAALDKHAKNASIVAMEARGAELDSPGFARELERLGNRGKGEIVFVLGGKAGLSDEIVRRADALWSMSRFTFPHRLARLVLVEQLYRATAILRNEPYAR
ncbi:MAG: 23S rRNA (pseudouridine(1915)-N(3))-methyltransferase RlmH [Polyangiaceae bacterium]